MLNVGILSAWHVHANGYANELEKSGKVCIKAIWDEDESRGVKWAKTRGIDFIPDYDEFLKRDDFSAVICNAPTTMHTELLIKAANAGKDIFTEKLLATNVAECVQINEAVEKNGVIFTISLPLRANPKILYAKQLVDSGALGRISGARMRRSHGGVSENWLPDYWYDVSKTGGGSLMDLGAHPVYVLSFLFGEPVRVSGMMSNLYGTTSDENAIVLVEFKEGVIGTCETAFVTYGVPDILEVYGSDGSLYIWGDEVKITTREMSKIGLRAVKPDIFPAGKPNPLMQFVDACINKESAPEHYNVNDALIMTKIIESAYISDKENKTVCCKYGPESATFCFLRNTACRSRRSMA